MRKNDMPDEVEEQEITIDIRQYSIIDYPRLKELYEEAGVFDQETDAEERLLSKIEQNPDSILVAFDDNEELLGSISIIEDGRIAILFRLVTHATEQAHVIRMLLLSYAERILSEYGYNEVHIMAHDEDESVQKDYAHYGFKKGKVYRWFWKEIDKKFPAD